MGAINNSTTVQDEATKVEVVAPIGDRQEEEVTAAETTTRNNRGTAADTRHRLRTGCLRHLELPALATDCHPRPRRLMFMVTAAGMVVMVVMGVDTTRATATAVAMVLRLHLPQGSTMAEEVVEDTKVRVTRTGLRLLRATMTAATMVVMVGMIVDMATMVVIDGRNRVAIIKFQRIMRNIGLCRA